MGKAKGQVTTAVARELVGFLWAIACEVRSRSHATRALREKRIAAKGA